MIDYLSQREKVKPNAKCCDWCKNFNENFECSLKGIKRAQLNHRLLMKLKREEEFRYCKNYRFSKIHFERYKTMCEENGKVTLSKWL